MTFAEPKWIIELPGRPSAEEVERLRDALNEPVLVLPLGARIMPFRQPEWEPQMVLHEAGVPIAHTLAAFAAGTLATLVAVVGAALLTGAI